MGALQIDRERLRAVELGRVCDGPEDTHGGDVGGAHDGQPIVFWRDHKGAIAVDRHVAYVAQPGRPAGAAIRCVLDVACNRRRRRIGHVDAVEPVGGVHGHEDVVRVERRNGQPARARKVGVVQAPLQARGGGARHLDHSEAPDAPGRDVRVGAVDLDIVGAMQVRIALVHALHARARGRGDGDDRQARLVHGRVGARVAVAVEGRVQLTARHGDATDVAKPGRVLHAALHGERRRPMAYVRGDSQPQQELLQPHVALCARPPRRLLLFF